MTDDHPPFMRKIQGRMNEDGHTYDGYYQECDGAPIEHKCFSSGDSVIRDECEQCANGGWNGYEISLCEVCDRLYCVDCTSYHHTTIKG